MEEAQRQFFEGLLTYAEAGQEGEEAFRIGHSLAANTSALNVVLEAVKKGATEDPETSALVSSEQETTRVEDLEKAMKQAQAQIMELATLLSLAQKEIKQFQEAIDLMSHEDYGAF